MLPLRPWQHRPVDGHRDTLVADSERRQQRRHGRVLGDLDGFVVHGDLHRALLHASTPTFSSAAIRSADHGASRNPDRPWPAATSVRSSSLPTMGTLSGVIGRSPAAHSASSYSPSAGTTSHASSSSSRTPATDGAVSLPCSYCVAPTTTPSARGTKYTCLPCTLA